jgi:hypothetical protein
MAPEEKESRGSNSENLLIGMEKMKKQNKKNKK